MILTKKIKKAIRKAFKNTDPKFDRLAEKVAKLAFIGENTREDGKMPVYVWGRDCDLCESSRIAWIPATLSALNRLKTDEYKWAEGPTSVKLISLEDAEEFQPTFRDRAAEMMNY